MSVGTAATPLDDTAIRRERMLAGLELLHPNGEPFELRVLGDNKPAGAHMCSPERGVLNCVKSPYAMNARSILTSLNPITIGLCDASSDRLSRDCKVWVSRQYVTQRRWLPVDVDPARRPPDKPDIDLGGLVAATEKEMQAARAVSESVEEFLAQHGFPAPVTWRTGNGYTLLYRVDLPNDDEVTKLVKQFLAALKKRFDTDDAHVDDGVAGPEIGIRVPGTFNRKGNHSDERPHRMVDFGEPDGGVSVVPREKLEQVAALAPQAATTAPTGSGPTGSGNRPSRKVLNVPRWLTDYGYQFTEDTCGGGQIFKLERCPFHEEHRNKAAFMAFPSGACSFKCHGGRCKNNGFSAARQQVGLPRPEHFDRVESGTSSAQLTVGSRVRCGDRDNIGTVAQVNCSQALIHWQSPDGQQSQKWLQMSELSPLDSTDTTNTPTIELIDSARLADSDSSPVWLVKGLLIAGQPVIKGGKSKVLKTTFAIDLAISLGTGTSFLNHFECPRKVRVMMLSGESGEWTIRETARRIADSKGIPLRSANVLWGFSLPKIGSESGLAGLAEIVTTNNIDVAIIDPAYLCLMSEETKGLNAANLFDVGPLLLRLAETMKAANCTPIVLHHCRKNSSGERYDPPELDELSMAGFPEFARQWFLIGRRETYSNDGHHKLWLNSGGPAVGGGLFAIDVDEGVVGDDFSGRRWSVSVRPGSELFKEKAKLKQTKQDEAKAAAKKERVAKDVKEIVQALLKLGPSTKSAIKNYTGINDNAGRLTAAIAAALDNGAVVETEVRVSNHKNTTQKGYAPRDPAEEP